MKTDNKYFKLKNKEFPLMVHQICSYMCNSRCPNCPFTETNSDTRKRYKEIDSQFVTPEIFKKTADECGKYHSIMRLTGGGETLLCPDIVNLVEYATNKGAKIGIITNGSILIPEKSTRLIDARIDNIEISVDAGDKDTYSKVRTGLDWNKLLNNIDYLVDYRNKTRSNTKIYVSVINQKYISSDIEKIVSFWNKRVDYTMVRKFLTFGLLDDNQSGDKIPFQDINSPCPWPFERLTVDTNGDIILCGHEQLQRFTNWGNVKERTIQSVWKGKDLQKLRENMLTNLDNLPYCKKCDDRRFKSWDYNYLKVLENVEKNIIKRSI